MTTAQIQRTGTTPPPGTFAGLILSSERLLGLSRFRMYPAGAVIIQEGDGPQGLHLLQRGLARLYRTGEDGQEAVLAVLGPGALLGEVALLDGGSQQLSAAALLPCLTLDIPRAPLLALLDEHPHAARFLCDELARRLRATTEFAADAGLLPLRERIIRRLNELAAHLGAEYARGPELTIPLRQRDLAAMVGGTRESVNRALGEMGHEGAVRLGRGSITLVRPRWAS